jgi:hypothetical protein
VTPTIDRSRQAGRRRAVIGALSLALIVGGVVAVVTIDHRGGLTTSSGPSGSSAVHTHGTPAPNTRPAPTTTLVPRPPYPVGSLAFTVTDPAAGPVPARSFTTYVRYPVGPGAAPAGTAPVPLRVAGPFPLVVFSGGYAVSPEEYAYLLDAWASAGFVVADPVYPSTTPSVGQTLDEGDIVHHPADLSAVITALIGADRGADTGPQAVLAGAIQSGAIAAIGHSDGGDVTLAAAADTCCRDPRIHAAVILSGSETTFFSGTYFPAGSAPPLLVVQGTADDINPSGCSVQLYDQAPQPRFYLSLAGQTHQSPYLEAGTARDTVQQVVTDFLLGTLGGSHDAVAAMGRDGDVPGSSTLVTGGPTGLPAGDCPGAPSG